MQRQAQPAVEENQPMWNEFKAFLVKTNTLAFALAVIIGVALGAVVNSLVKDITCLRVLAGPVGAASGCLP
jgi:large-conductance mechanosensitive channel